MSATGSSGLLLEHYAGIRSAVNAIRTRLIDLLTGLSNWALCARSTLPLAKHHPNFIIFQTVRGMCKRVYGTT